MRHKTGRGITSIGRLAPALCYLLRPRPPRFGNVPLPSPTSQPKRQNQTRDNICIVTIPIPACRISRRPKRRGNRRSTSAMRPRAIIWRLCPDSAARKVFLPPLPSALRLHPGHRRQCPRLSRNRLLDQVGLFPCCRARLAFNISMMVVIVFQLRVVADPPSRFSSWLKKPMVRILRR